VYDYQVFKTSHRVGGDRQCSREISLVQHQQLTYFENICSLNKPATIQMRDSLEQLSRKREERREILLLK
jgi:hypothetical protein